ncbi:hypothetical protein [Variovorax paradoxus]|uniref:Coil containing protein n=1 Tax=Variovorax paradoxus (strain EPS) TaxID=595537 RepID=E6V3R9_VARPE|nr:hypothetical protein [Variovorax paradoxus]ADU36943.1 hypothetical protein Varpa_2745 [Variovorax paradoxus EPS]
MGIVEGGVLAYAALAASAVGTAVSVYSQEKQADREDDLAKQQQMQSQQDAQYTASEAELQAKTIRKAADKQRAEARAALAGSGVVVGEGTAEQIDQEIQAGGEEDALMAIYDGTNRARSIARGGDLAASRSRNAASASRTGALTSAFQGGATIARGWNTSGGRKG